jgi:hypothetical protein
VYNIDLKRTNRLVRNEFYTVGDYDMPFIYRQTPDLSNIQFIGYHNTKTNDVRNTHKTVHFFIEDHKFNGVFSFPEQSLHRLEQYKQVLSPDFSLYIDMPLPLQIKNTFKRRWCSAWWQSKELTVIPSVTWGDKRSFAFCFDGIEKNAIVAISTTSALQHRTAYLAGFYEMCKQIQPEKIICYGKALGEMKRNADIIEIQREGNVAQRLKRFRLSGQKELFSWVGAEEALDKPQDLAQMGIHKFGQRGDLFSLISKKTG